MRGANRNGAMVVIVERTGHISFRNDPIYSDELATKIRESVSRGAEPKVYIKADARARYGDVERVLDAMRSAGVEQVSILADESTTSSLR